MRQPRLRAGASVASEPAELALTRAGRAGPAAGRPGPATGRGALELTDRNRNAARASRSGETARAPEATGMARGRPLAPLAAPCQTDNIHFEVGALEGTEVGANRKLAGP